jgi:hypothetical protein
MEIVSFHQWEVRCLINDLINKYDLYLTDLIKCYIDNAEFECAGIYRQKYLEKQINSFQPNIIILFGGDVLNKFYKTLGINLNQKSGFEEPKRRNGEIKKPDKAHAKIVGDYKNIPVMFSFFPGGQAADAWISNMRPKNKILESLEIII